MTLLLVTGAAVAVEAAPVMGFVDPSWALPVNTFLLLVLSLMQAHERRQLNRVRRDVRDAKRKIGAARRNHTDPDTGERRRWND